MTNSIVTTHKQRAYFARFEIKSQSNRASFSGHCDVAVGVLHALTFGGILSSLLPSHVDGIVTDVKKHCEQQPTSGSHLNMSSKLLRTPCQDL